MNAAYAPAVCACCEQRYERLARPDKRHDMRRCFPCRTQCPRQGPCRMVRDG